MSETQPLPQPQPDETSTGKNSFSMIIEATRLIPQRLQVVYLKTPNDSQATPPQESQVQGSLPHTDSEHK